MDSLLANYASSDEEEEHSHQSSSSFNGPTSSSSSIALKPSPLFSSLPRPKQQPSQTYSYRSNNIDDEEEDPKPSIKSSSSLFSSLPHPKQQPSKPKIQDSTAIENEEDSKPSSKSSSSIFGSLPQSKSQAPQQPISKTSPLVPNPKRVVKFNPPINLSKPTNLGDDDDEEEEKKEPQQLKESESLSQLSSVKSFLSSIPMPKNSSTLGALPSVAGSGRRSIIETEAPTSNSGGLGAENESGFYENVWSHENYGNYATYESGSFDQSGGNYVNYASYGNYESTIDQDFSQNAGGDGSSYGSYDNYGSYGVNNWDDGSRAAVSQTFALGESAVRVPGKRGRNEMPTEIVEVKQDELIKNRPREDQVKLTGIAFGPSYQPASTKGKPSKLHKRKHQIGSLFFDMKQKEMELAERRSRGLLTKTQTQGKYGW